MPRLPLLVLLMGLTGMARAQPPLAPAPVAPPASEPPPPAPPPPADPTPPTAPAAAPAADPAAASERARQLIAAAEEAMARAAYPEALARLLEAQALFPSSRILYDLGVVQVALGTNARALESFERFLREAPAVAAEQRSWAQAEVARLTPLVGTVVVTGNQDGTLTVDGQHQGDLSAGAPRPVRVDPGTRRIALSRDGQYASQDVAVGAGQTLPLTLLLQSPPAVAAAVPLPLPVPLPPYPGVPGPEAAPPPPAATLADADPGQRSWHRPLARGLITGGSLAVAGGVLFAVISKVESGWSDERGCPRPMDEQCERSQSNIGRFRNLSYVMFGLGAASVGGGVVFYVNAPREAGETRAGLVGGLRGAF